MMSEEKDQQAFEKREKKDAKKERGHTPLDEFEDQQFVDDIPLDDLEIEMEQEEKKEQSQDDSQSARKP